eukprot:scaffold13748_cov16-Tisochrysis_lutea.AAC.1
MGIPGPKLVVPDPHNAFIALTGFGPGTPMLKACPIRTHINHIIIIIIIKIKACPIHTHAVAGSREESHALCTHVDEEKENVVHVPIKRGSITVHDERVVHGSGANRSNVWRNAYVLAFRKAECIKEEREHGFTHSHNDTHSWDAFNK